MMVRCVSSSGRILPEEFCNTQYGITRSTRYNLTEGRIYLVLAITNIIGYNFFYILEDGATDNPTPVPSPLFEIVDGRMSRHWKYQQELRGQHLANYFFLIALPEWIEDKMFLENLMDGSPPQVLRFGEQVKLLREEFDV
jgi:hypothetical protein